MTKVRVTLVMEIFDENGHDLTTDKAVEVAETTEDSIRSRLFGEGFLTDDLMVEVYGFDSQEGD